MKWDWNTLFGEKTFIELKKGERTYFGLNEMNVNDDKTIFYSKTNLWYKRTTLFWQNDVIIKVIAEENMISVDERIVCRCYREFDTKIKTENREWILPMTSRGKKKKVTATHVLSIPPFGCSFYYSLNERKDGKSHSIIVVDNPRNNQRLSLGEYSKISRIQNGADFREFVEEYIATCPPNYFERVDRMRNEKHKTVKYRAGDIFRMEIDRFRYCYGLITGEVKSILKWEELPKRHSLRQLMMVPIMVRYYQLVTERGDLTEKDLKDIPLSRVELCGDNDIIWGSHPIVGHKKLEAEDLEFNLVCVKFTTINKHDTLFTQEFLMRENMRAIPEEYNVYVEWGPAAVSVSSSQLSEKLREYLKDYSCPHGGVSMRIEPMIARVPLEEMSSWPEKPHNLLEKSYLNMREELFSCLGLKKDATFDAFAKKFGGLTKEECVKRMRCERGQT